MTSFSGSNFRGDSINYYFIDTCHTNDFQPILSSDSCIFRSLSLTPHYVTYLSNYKKQCSFRNHSSSQNQTKRDEHKDYFQTNFSFSDKTCVQITGRDNSSFGCQRCIPGFRFHNRFQVEFIRCITKLRFFFLLLFPQNEGKMYLLCSVSLA